jgi:hypothetical protein
VIATASSEYSKKQTRTQPAARRGGSRRHHVGETPPWLSGRARASSTGTAARKGQEKGSTATPKTKVATGSIRIPATSVKITLTANVSAGCGARKSRGQDSRTKMVFSADRPSSKMTTPAANSSHDRL